MIHTVDPKLEDLPNNEYWIENGIDLVRRKIMIDREIQETNANAIIRAILLMEQLDKYSPIDVFINSPGGECYLGFGIYDVLVGSSCPINTVGIGHVMSMATIITLAGDCRTAYKNTRYMVHSVSDDPAEGKVFSLKVNYKESEYLLKKIIEIYAERTNKDAFWWTRFIEHKDRYLDAQAAKELGIIDEIV